MDDPAADARIGATLVFLGRLAARWLRSLAGYPRFSWTINAGSTQGLPELVALAAEGEVVAPLAGPPRAADMAGLREMWGVQQSGRAPGKLVMRWRD